MHTSAASYLHPGDDAALLAISEVLACLPRPLVFTNGVFDLLHAGHVACLEAARSLGASLVVGVNSDASARHLQKGPGRPINTAADRARVVGALSAVSAVIVFDQHKPLALICALRPDIYVKGGDYRVEELAEARLMAEWGGRTEIIARDLPLSTTALVNRVLAAAWRGPAGAAAAVSGEPAGVPGPADLPPSGSAASVMSH